MDFILLETITKNIRLKANEDGTITVSNLIVKVGIVGSPKGKFIQVDVVKPDVIIPANTSTSEQDSYLEKQAQNYVKTTYPNS